MQRNSELTATYVRLFPKRSEETDEGGEEANKEIAVGNNFYQYWGWQIAIDTITKGDATKEDEVLNWNIVKFLNKLSYLKDKHDYEVEQIKLHGK